MSDYYQGLSVFGLNDINGNSVIGTTGSAAPPASLQVAGVASFGGDGNLHTLRTDNDGNLYVLASIAPPSDSTATGTLTTTAASLPVSTAGTSALFVQLLITSLEAGATINFQVALDGIPTWQTATLFPIPTVGSQEGAPPVSLVTGPI